MDRIFGAAAVTLVAAATQSARCGIRGVTPRDITQHQVKLKGYDLTLSQPSLIKIVDDSKCECCRDEWNERS